jgi:hypothetical protein
VQSFPGVAGLAALAVNRATAISNTSTNLMP